MLNISRRLGKAEKALNLSGEHITVKMVCYGGELPPDRTQGNITVQYVMYDKKENQCETLAGE